MKLRLAAAIAVALALVTCADASAAVTAPPGVRVTVAASRVPRPTNLAFDASGAMWVTTAEGSSAAPGNGVWRVAARHGARPRHVVRGLRLPLGLAWHRRELYVSHLVRVHGRQVGQITAFSRFDGLRFHHRRVVVSGIPVGEHDVDSLAWGPDGRLYIGVGSVGNARRGPSRLSASVISVPPSGRGLRVEARGLRNPYGLAFLPGTPDLLVSENGRDDLGLLRPPDELDLVRTEVRGSAWYGFPGCWGQGGRACRHATAALVRLPSHAAAAGLAVTRRFGGYGLSAFVAQNGSSFPAHPTGNVVDRVVLRRRAGRWTGVLRPFARGFVHNDPVGAAIGPGGALYVTLYVSGQVLRFSPRPAVHHRSTNR